MHSVGYNKYKIIFVTYFVFCGLIPLFYQSKAIVRTVVFVQIMGHLVHTILDPLEKLLAISRQK